jgi:hypothetical protein
MNNPHEGPASTKGLTFLTRDGCVNTPEMVANLDRALETLGWPNDYQCVDIGTLPASDVRTGYPTPTLLYKDHDLFGMSVPKPPYDVPS